VLVFLACNLTQSKKYEANNNLYFDQTDLIIVSRKTEINIRNISKISVSETFHVKNTQVIAESSLYLWFNYSIGVPFVEDIEGRIQAGFERVEDHYKLTIPFRNPLEENAAAVFDVYYELFCNLNNFTYDDKKIYEFKFIPTISHFTEKHEVTIILPSDAANYAVNGIPFFPETGDLELDPITSRYQINWVINNIPSEPIHYDYFVYFYLASKDPRRNYFYVIIASSLIIGLLAGIGLTSWLVRFTERRSIKQIGNSLLTDNQKELLRVVFENDGKVSQKDLCDILEYSKSKISRNIVPLEERGMLRREKWGRTYVVYITDSGRKVIE
jgi:hypothetical protein